ncbi:Chromate transport protein [Jeotgalicoccus aerolatus]|uniref:Chromate transporter n=1 Tax=Jeotgalicoccus aerolatus TaxID=709510 RepID=A0ABS4HML9_9STAP|nr:chromate transporter [Jeotgalicoccus aerolatus]MBP1952161.1 chromate transporter [Jeotgalicoccus aerolatus]GGE06368.1 putative transporter YwrA [Jeotgalicoccus aerolatus]CAD2070758.1 Chromate transport protein [Jeotgalicoccus aerolatus]
MIYLEIFLAFLIPGILGYGGGPSSIPLVEREVVGTYEWMTTAEFAEVLALGNALPGPILTKMGAYIGYEAGGVLGSIVAISASVLPSLLLMIFLAAILYKLKGTNKFKTLTLLIRPVIAILLGVIVVDFLFNSFDVSGTFHTVFLIIVSFLLLQVVKLHPAVVIVIGLIYGGLFIR